MYVSRVHHSCVCRIASGARLRAQVVAAPWPRGFTKQAKMADAAADSSPSTASAASSKKANTRKKPLKKTVTGRILGGLHEKPYLKPLMETSKDAKHKSDIVQTVLLKPASAMTIPNISFLAANKRAEQKILDSLNGKVTILSMIFSQFAIKHADEWNSGIPDDITDSRKIQRIELFPVMNFLGMKLFRGMMVRNTNKIRADVGARIGNCFDLTTDQLKALSMDTNQVTAYVLLLDKHGRIRWRGSGSPQAIEIECLNKFAHQLVEEAEAERK